MTLITAIVFLNNGCAIRVTPQGGMKDEMPPKLLKSNPPNFSVNFTAKEITLKFDEYITLKEVSRQLITSPFMRTPPEVKLKGKELIIELKDTLKTNTTYTLNFGKSITDVNEGNVLEGFQYVFSTGTVLDSLELHGNVINALTLAPEKSISILLYSTNEDSLPYKSLPEYFTTTDESGNFVFRNMHEGAYKIIALKDDNSNYLFESNIEGIGFSNSTVSIPDTGSQTLKLFIQKDEIAKLLRTQLDEKNKVQLSFSAPVLNFNYKLLDAKIARTNIVEERSTNNDTIVLWINDTVADSLNMVVYNDNLLMDTVLFQIRAQSKQVTIGRGRSSGIGLQAGLNSSGGIIEMNVKPVITFNHPLKNFDKEKIILTVDSLPQKINSIKQLDSLNRKFELNIDLKFLKNYSLLIPSRAATDIFGMQNDSIEMRFSTRDEKDYGSLALSFNATKDAAYILQLVTEDDNVVRELNATNKKMELAFLLPGKYKLRAIKDSNNNGKWDTGNYLKKIQPEEVFYYTELITIRANWDVEVKWGLKF